MSLGYFYIDCFFTIILIILLFKSFKHRNKRAVNEFITLLALTIVSLTFFSASLVINVNDFNLKTFVHEMKFLGAAFFSVCFYDMYMSFWGKKKPRKTILLMSIIPAVSVLLALTNNYHHLFRSSYYLVGNDWGSFVGVNPSIAYYIYLAYSYVLYLYDVALVLMTYFRTPRIYRQQSGFMFLTSALTLVINIVSATGLLYEDFGDLSLIMLAISNIVHYICLVVYKPTKMIQLARSLALNEIKNPIIIFDYRNIFFEANTTAHELLKIDNGETIEAFYKNRLGVLSVPDFINCDSDITCVLDDVYYSVCNKRAIDEENIYSGNVLLFNNITEMKKKETILQELAMKDYLTGFPNKRLFNQRIESVNNDSMPISIIFFDISRMKLINNIFGIVYGDTVIKKVALLLSENIQNGFFSHLEGGLFAVMLENSPEEKAHDLINRVNAALTESQQSFRYKVRLNYGLAIKTTTKDNLQLILKQAMENLNHNKLLVNAAEDPEFVNILDHLAEIDKSIATHSEFFKTVSEKVGIKLDLSVKQLNDLQLLNSIHNIGLIALPIEIATLNEFTDEQHEIYKQHTIKGYNIAATAKELSCVAKEILTHHEHYDGSGYPHGLKGEDIPILSRILAVCNCATELIVAQGMKPSDAIAKLNNQAEKYDPAVLQALIDVMR